MAIPKICGLETEFGIMVRGADNNPVTASALLINAYVASAMGSAGFDPEAESPEIDARGFRRALGLDPDPEAESMMVNAVLTNGARYYVDHAHPEMSIPEVADALEAVTWDRAGEEILRRSMQAAATVLPAGAEIIVHKNNSDGKGNSYGCHENYLVDRAVPFGRIVGGVMAHFVTRQVFCGAGKVGCEAPGRDSGDVTYQISQRADFFEEEVGLETTVKRPIVNTRDEPHCDPDRYRRLHVIAGDANMSETATFLKVASTAIVLAMIEDGWWDRIPQVANPVAAIRQVSHDPSLRATIAMADAGRATALEIQWTLLELANEYAASHGLAVVGEAVGELALNQWAEVLSGLERDPASVADRVDWVAKQRMIGAYAVRHGLDAGSPRLRAVDLQYHDLRPERCLADRAGLRRLVDPVAVAAAVVDPPTSTRAYFRGRCVAKYGRSVVAANWDSIVFDLGHDPLRRVPMMEPLRGTRDHVGTVLDESPTAAELIRRLGS